MAAHGNPLKLVLGIALIVVGAWIVLSTIPSANSGIDSYEECVAAGYPILKTYPGQCVMPDGTKFIQPIAMNSFEECAKWYPVMESYPRQCRDGAGKTWIEPVSTTGCASDAECTLGYFCKSGLCTEFIPDIACQKDEDCVLINSLNRFSCCYQGYCDEIDYANPKWKAVNAEWYTSNREKNCPASNECGPQPGCPTIIKEYNGTYGAQCQQNVCQKTFQTNE